MPKARVSAHVIQILVHTAPPSVFGFAASPVRALIAGVLLSAAKSSRAAWVVNRLL